MNSLPIGMYQPGYTCIHLLKAETKIICFTVFAAAVILSDSIFEYLAMLGFVLLVIGLAKLPYRTAFSPVKRLIWFFAIIMLMNVFFFSPDSAWFRLGIFAPSEKGLLQGISVVVRVLYVLVMGNTLTLTTSPFDLTEAIETLLLPLSLLKIPTGQIAMILSVAIQFIPTLFEETDMIRKAQIARGARFDSRKFREKAAAILPLAVPVFISAFRRADELSLAMEARGYRTDVKRRRRNGRRLERRDFAAFIICSALLTGILAL